VVAQVITESAIIGGVGGAVGLALGMGSILAVTILQRWVPVFDMLLAPVAVIAGVMVGMAGGLVAAARAARIQPSEALRQ
jgi:macrolide transport system ATP-binding/permease protein